MPSDSRRTGSSLGEPGARSRGWAQVAPAAAGVGVALAVLGQLTTSRDINSHLGFLARAARYLQDVYPRNTRSVLFAALLLLVGMLVFAVATRAQDAGDAEFLPERTTGVIGARPAMIRPARALAGAIFVVGMLPWLYVVWHLHRDGYNVRLPWLLWWAILGVGVAVLLGRWTTTVRRGPSLRAWEIVLLAAALAFFLVVTLRDVDSWRYALIGDEYAFFDFARALAEDRLKADVFSTIGVYGYRPVGTSLLQATTMRIFGDDSNGWRIATPLALAATVPAVFIAARELFDRTVAAFATLVFATSHYLIAYAHTAYDNIFAITPFAWCIALAVAGLRRRSAFWLYAAGIAGGLGFYTFPTARMAPVVVLLFIVTLGRRAWTPAVLVPLGLGLMIAGMPLFATDGWHAITSSSDHTVFAFQDSHTEGVAIRLIENVPRSLLAWNYNPNPAHFVSGSLLDPVSAVFLVLGLGFALARVRHPAHRLLAIWLGVDVLFAGVFSPYDRVSADRLHLALPVIAIYVAIGIVAVIRWLSAVEAPVALPSRYLGVALFVALAPALAWLNLHRFLVESPRALGSPPITRSTEERIALGGLRSGACHDAGGSAMALISRPTGLLDAALSAYGDSRVIVTRRIEAARNGDDYGLYGCVVVTRPHSPSPDDRDGKTACVDSCWHEVQPFVERLEGEFGFTQADVVWLGPAWFYEAVVLTRY